MEKEEKKQVPKLRIKIKAYDWRVADNCCRQIIETVKTYGGRISGPVPLPTEIRRYTVLRSPFVHKDSREQFEIRIHKRLIDVLEPDPKIIEALQALTLPSGVDVEIKMVG